MHIVLTQPCNIDGTDYPAGKRIDNLTHPSTVKSLLRCGRAKHAERDPEPESKPSRKPKPEPVDADEDDEPIEAPAPGTEVVTPDGQPGTIADVEAEPEPVPAPPAEPVADEDADRGVPMDEDEDDGESEELDPEPIGDEDEAEDDPRPIDVAGLAEGWTEKLTAAGLDTIGKAKAKAAEDGYSFAESIKGIGDKAEAKIRETLAGL